MLFLFYFFFDVCEQYVKPPLSPFTLASQSQLLFKWFAADSGLYTLCTTSDVIKWKA